VVSQSPDLAGVLVGALIPFDVLAQVVRHMPDVRESRPSIRGVIQRELDDDLALQEDLPETTTDDPGS
jgi:hypothetical protein